MYLRYQDPNSNAIRDFPIRKPIVSIGRTSSNDIVLSDAMIAPTHANILPLCFSHVSSPMPCGNTRNHGQVVDLKIFGGDVRSNVS